MSDGGNEDELSEDEKSLRDLSKMRSFCFWSPNKPPPSREDGAEEYVNRRSEPISDVSLPGPDVNRLGASWATNKNKILSEMVDWYENHPHRLRHLETQAIWRQNNQEKQAELRRQWAAANPEKVLARIQKRRAAKYRAVPLWFSDWDQFVLEQACELAILRRRVTGIDWQTDHMIPLLAKKACGLHCAANVQVIPRLLNTSKCNQMVLTEPLEWLQHL